MFDRARNWFRRNRGSFAIGAGVAAGGYLAGQYVLNKVTEARQRMSDERIARENLRRRFEQNQEDCTFTILAILPTATENIIEALPVEQTLNELQKQKVERLARSGVAMSEVSTDLPSGPPSLTEIDGKSLTNFSESESYVHASQVAPSETGNGEKADVASQPKRSKVQMWNDIKISSIARAFTLIYTLSLLTLLTRIQLNLLGRRNYLASVVSLASPPSSSQDNNHHIFLENHDDDNFENAYGNDYETNRKYLSFSWWLLHRGCKEIMQKVLQAVKEVFGPLSPREDISLEKLSELTVEVRKKIEGSTEQDRRTTKYLPYLLPPADEEASVLQQVSGILPANSPPSSPITVTETSETTSIPPTLRRLLDESSDLIDSPSFHHVLTLLLDSAFSLLIDNKIASLAYKIPPTSASTSRVIELVNPKEVKAKVANTLAVFCRQAHVIGSGGQVPGVGGNEYLAGMEQVRDLEAFAAVVYSSNFDFEAPEITLPGLSSVECSRPGTAGMGNGNGGKSGKSGFEAAWEKALAKEDGKGDS
ncbi:Peroxin-3 [Rhizodiscina lignyota]|uniref:Peroxin-3 n=1 Tax=Rhizodiscina lignyota TaxID=1504668 RepID=A0A9P4M432_9PEZI|nr:Peroxin-3 [Rhizodiscina lignyota]